MLMEQEKYVCPECNQESSSPGECPDCQTQLVSTCAVCGNPLVGEHVHTET
jgi:predicted amidophosphoribosyltransferase